MYRYIILTVNKCSKLHLIFAVLITFFLEGCSSDKFVPNNEYLLEKVRLKSDVKTLDTSLLEQYIRQKGNSKWFSLFKVPLKTYSLSGKDTTKWINRTLKKIGEKPVLYDSLQAKLSIKDLIKAMQNMGYINAKVTFNKHIRGKKLTAIYNLSPGEPYMINNFSYDIQDSIIAKILSSHLNKSFYKNNQMPFTVSSLDAERKRLTQILNDSGFYHFHKEFIYYTADSISKTKLINITLHLMPYYDNNYKKTSIHPRYIINNINIIPADSNGINLRKGVLADNIMFEKGKYFSASDLQKTYNNFARLGSIRYTNINFKESPHIDSLVIGKKFLYKTSNIRYLDADIQILNNKPNTISLQPEGTNTAGDLGAAATLSYQNRNLFKGSEKLEIELRGAFEAIKGLEGYSDKNYEDYSIKGSMLFPRLLAPFTSKSFRRKSSATTEFIISWDFQNRPEFHRRVFSSGLKYNWSTITKQLSYNLDVFKLSYVYMPWISKTFKQDYLYNISNRNAILKYNYRDLFIMSSGIDINYKTLIHSLKARIETAGNLLDAVSGIFNFQRNNDGQKKFIKIAYAQYVKFDLDYTYLYLFDKNNSLALHADLGIAYPYSNSKILPFEKRYFAGGANSVRGWSVRELGPGNFKKSDGRIDFINQTGDIKLDLNAEYRTHLLWKLDGAAFIDAGNIWTIRNYKEQNGGQFEINKFYKQIAVSYGLGIRFNFNFFILRLDAGMKAINPAYNTLSEHYALWHPILKRDLTFHFAVGLPF